MIIKTILPIVLFFFFASDAFPQVPISLRHMIGRSFATEDAHDQIRAAVVELFSVLELEDEANTDEVFVIFIEDVLRVLELELDAKAEEALAFAFVLVLVLFFVLVLCSCSCSCSCSALALVLDLDLALALALGGGSGSGGGGGGSGGIVDVGGGGGDAGKVVDVDVYVCCRCFPIISSPVTGPCSQSRPRYT